MRLYLLRHGIAEAQQPGRADSERALTEEGKQKLRRVLNRAKAGKMRPALILSSPYVRALETARLAAEVLDCKAPIVETRALVPSSSPVEAWRLVRDHAEADSILLVGHEPLFSTLASFLLGASRTILEMKKGALVCLEMESTGPAPRGVLQWLLTQRLAGPADSGG